MNILDGVANEIRSIKIMPKKEKENCSWCGGSGQTDVYFSNIGWTNFCPGCNGGGTKEAEERVRERRLEEERKRKFY